MELQDVYDLPEIGSLLLSKISNRICVFISGNLSIGEDSTVKMRVVHSEVIEFIHPDQLFEFYELVSFDYCC